MAVPIGVKGGGGGEGWVYKYFKGKKKKRGEIGWKIGIFADTALSLLSSECVCVRIIMLAESVLWNDDL